MCDKVRQLEAHLAEAVELFRALNRSRSYSGMLNIMLDVQEFLDRHAAHGVRNSAMLETNIFPRK